MDIPNDDYGQIRALNVNEHKVNCKFDYWREYFSQDKNMLSKLDSIQGHLGDSFGRKEVVDYYLTNEVLENKFLAAMIWGHEAPEGSRRDTRGPWKVGKMFESKNLGGTLSSVDLGSVEKIKQAYTLMDKQIDKCGPSFLTKHLYFLGKSIYPKKYPLIFDDRVAIGLVKLSLKNSSCLNYVTIHALRKKNAYADYLNFATRQAEQIDCDLDSIEYYLFRLGG